MKNKEIKTDIDYPDGIAEITLVLHKDKSTTIYERVYDENLEELWCTLYCSVWKPFELYKLLVEEHVLQKRFNRDDWYLGTGDLLGIEGYDTCFKK